MLGVHSKRRERTARKVWRDSSSVNFRFSSNLSLAFATNNRGLLIGYMFRSIIICRRCSWALTPPRRPVEALITAAGLPLHEASLGGLLPHSRAFFRTAVTE